jgi:hypothetical protein
MSTTSMMCVLIAAALTDTAAVLYTPAASSIMDATCQYFMMYVTATAADADIGAPASKHSGDNTSTTTMIHSGGSDMATY